jgi:hypothetical protein
MFILFLKPLVYSLITLIMNEIFDIISAVNRLRERVDDLDARIAFLCKYPSMVAFNDYVEEEAACRFLHVSASKLYQMRQKGEIPYFRGKRKILYPVADLVKYLANNTVQIKDSA